MDSPQQSTGCMELPIASCREELKKYYGSYNVLIIVGETGSGKSTQVPKFILQDFKKDFKKKGIAVTQPRRIAAISLASRVSNELGEKLGRTVGYRVRFDENISKMTKITYMTDGMLLVDSNARRKFLKYKCIILDEVHERTINTDLLLGLVKKAQKLRKKCPLKLIIMSATMDVDNIKSYFKGSEVLLVKGATFPVSIQYMPCDQGTYLERTLIAVLKMHQEYPIENHMLVFVTGYEEICVLIDALEKAEGTKPMQLYPLCASLSHDRQLQALKPCPPGVRKIVVATNVAETSLTIPKVGIVIDSCRVKTKYYNQAVGIEYLRVEKVSRAQAEQRAGRTGRDCPGTVLRILKEQDMNTMKRFSEPEIKKSDMCSVALSIACRGFRQISRFPWLDSPSVKNIEQAIKDLSEMRAIEATDQPLTVTEKGRMINKFPLEPRLALVVLNSKSYGVVDQVCAIVACMSGDSIFIDTCGQKIPPWQRLLAKEGDLITYLNILTAFRKNLKSKFQFCQQNFLNLRSLVFANKVRKYLKKDLLATECAENHLPQNIKELSAIERTLRCFADSLPHNKARRADRIFYKIERGGGVLAKLHPRSALIPSKPSVILFADVLEDCDGNLFIKHCSYVDPVW